MAFKERDVMKTLRNVDRLEKHLIIFYGGHGEDCYAELEPLLEKKIEELKKNHKRYFFVIENGGPYPQQIKCWKRTFKGLVEEENYNNFCKIVKSSFYNYIKKGEKSFHTKLEGKDVNINLREFDIKLIDLALKHDLDILFEEPKYEDFLKTRDYHPPIPMHIFIEITKEFSQEFGKSYITVPNEWEAYYKRRILEEFTENLKFREDSFIKQIHKLSKDNSNTSFMIMRGSIHKAYFENIVGTFKKDFEVIKIEYGEQVEDIYS